MPRAETIRGLARGLRVLAALQSSPISTLHEIHRATHISKPSLLRILNTLPDAGFVSRRLADGRLPDQRLCPWGENATATIEWPRPPPLCWTGSAGRCRRRALAGGRGSARRWRPPRRRFVWLSLSFHLVDWFASRRRRWLVATHHHAGGVDLSSSSSSSS